MCMREFVQTHRSVKQLLAFWRDVSACCVVEVFGRYTRLFCGYAGLFFEDVEGSCADEQTPYIHRPLLQESPTQEGPILKREFTI